MTDARWVPATEQAELVRSGEVSARELVAVSYTHLRAHET